MTDFTEKMRRKGQAEEDLYFARLDHQLITALHEQQAKKIDVQNETVQDANEINNKELKALKSSA